MPVRIPNSQNSTFPPSMAMCCAGNSFGNNLKCRFTAAAVFQMLRNWYSYSRQSRMVRPELALKASITRSGGNYNEAVECLKGRYNRPRLIHRAHVRTIMESPSLKEGSAKELRSLHDMLQQHLRALKSMKLEPDLSFITSIIELKLDATTLFE